MISKIIGFFQALGFFHHSFTEGGKMKLSRIALALLFVALTCSPALAGDKTTWGLGLQIDYGSRDMAFDDMTSSQGAVTSQDIAQMEHYYKYTEAYHTVGLVGSWLVTNNITLKGTIGFSDYDLKADYFGTLAGYDSYKFTDDFSDLAYGLCVDFVGPVSDSLALGLSVSGQLVDYRDGAFSVNGMQVVPGGTVSRVDADVERWNVEIFPRAIFTGKKLTFYIGPTYTKAGAKLEVRTYTTAGRYTDTIKLEEDNPWAVKAGVHVPLTREMAADLSLSLMGTTGATVGISYFF